MGCVHTLMTDERGSAIASTGSALVSWLEALVLEVKMRGMECWSWCTDGVSEEIRGILLGATRSRCRR